MNKKLKLAILSSLAFASGITFSLIVASCSSSVEVIEEDYSTNNDLIGEELEDITINVGSHNAKLLGKEFIASCKNSLVKEFIDDFVDYFEVWKEYDEGELFEFINSNLELKDKFDEEVIYSNVVEKVIIIKGAKRTSATIIEPPHIGVVLKEHYRFRGTIIIANDELIDIQ